MITNVIGRPAGTRIAAGLEVRVVDPDRDDERLRLVLDGPGHDRRAERGREAEPESGDRPIERHRIATGPTAVSPPGR